MIFDNEITSKGTKRKKYQYFKNGRKAMKQAFSDMILCNISPYDYFSKEKLIKEMNQHNNIIYLH